MKFIYLIQNKINNKIYIGKTSNIKLRWSQHKCYAKKSEYKKYGKRHYIHNAINKYGVSNFTITEIESFNNDTDAFEGEKFWIQYFRSWDSNFGYNLTLGGEGSSGYKLSKEHKEKISNKLLGNQNASGSKHTELTKNKMSVSHNGVRNPKAKLTEEDVLEIRKFHSENIFTDINVFGILSKKYNLSISGLEKIIYKKTWKFVK